MRKAFKVFRTFVAALIIFCIAAPTGITAFAVDELPSAFWPINNAYISAKENGDDDGIIRYGEQSIEFLSRYNETNTIREILASRYYDVADAYDRRNDFVTAAYYYEKYIPYGEYMGWTDGVIIARSKISQYTPVVKNYTETNVPQVYYGAKNEPEMGVLYGEVVEHTRENESMVLVYVNYGDDLPTWAGAILDTARQRVSRVEIALNILDEGLAVDDIPNHGEYIERLTDSLTQYADVPIYLRIGAGMNIWTILPIRMSISKRLDLYQVMLKRTPSMSRLCGRCLTLRAEYRYGGLLPGRRICGLGGNLPPISSGIFRVRNSR